MTRRFARVQKTGDRIRSAPSAWGQPSRQPAKVTVRVTVFMGGGFGGGLA